jgi:formylglycine-generating enzyme required for sulfatase activity
MTGNVWDRTRSLWGEDVGKPDYRYPCEPTDDTREDLKAPDEVLRVVRGGSFGYSENLLRAAYRLRYNPGYRGDDIGFRLVSSRLRS